MPRARTRKTLKQKVEAITAKALATDRFLLACFRIEGDQILLDRLTNRFPLGDFEPALALLAKDLRGAAMSAREKAEAP